MKSRPILFSAPMVRRLWRIEFETRFVEFQSVIADEPFARRNNAIPHRPLDSSLDSG